MNLIGIKDINAPELDIFARTTENQLRTISAPEPGIFLAETGSVILRALEAGYEPLSMLVENGRLEDINLTSTKLKITFSVQVPDKFPCGSGFYPARP